jgi:phosphotransacetylase
MHVHHFSDMIEYLKDARWETCIAVPQAHSRSALTAALDFWNETGGKARILLIGDEETIVSKLEDCPYGAGVEVVAAENEREAVLRAIDLAHAGQAEIVLKGSLASDVLMRTIVQDKRLFVPGRIITHIRVFETPRGMVFFSDGGINIISGFPLARRLAVKRAVIENAATVAALLGEKECGIALLVGEQGRSSWQEEDFITLALDMGGGQLRPKVVSAQEAFSGLRDGGRMPHVFVFPWIGPANIVDKACNRLPEKACTPWPVTHVEDVRIDHAGLLKVFRWSEERLAVAVPGPKAKAEQKERLLEAAVRYMRQSHQEVVKVAILDFTERTSQFDTVSSLSDGESLAKRFEERTDCVVEGPMAYDIAVSRESARIKGFRPKGKPSRVAGNPDVLFTPDFDAGMLLGAVYEHWQELELPWKGADISFGGRVPVLVPSRSDSGEFKLRSIVTAAYIISVKKSAISGAS